ncbi:hypothetical protein R8510_02189 [Ralstonia chuxiongensis]|nr:hypothetical protein R8510_02189 [Ralstonia chuxiongensis]
MLIVLQHDDAKEPVVISAGSYRHKRARALTDFARASVQISDLIEAGMLQVWMGSHRWPGWRRCRRPSIHCPPSKAKGSVGGSDQAMILLPISFSDATSVGTANRTDEEVTASPRDSA